MCRYPLGALKRRGHVPVVRQELHVWVTRRAERLDELSE